MRAALLLTLTLLAACGQRDSGGLPADDQRALNEAAASIDNNNVDAPSDQGNNQ